MAAAMRTVGIAPKYKTWRDDEHDDRLALITVWYGGRNELRKHATMTAIYDWDKQEEKPDDAIFLELVCPGDESSFEQDEFPKWIRYMRIYGKERNRNLFQKEAMWNLAAKYTNAGKLLFIDSDVSMVDELHYFSKMKDAIQDGTVVHACFKLQQDGYEEDSYYHDMYSVMAPKEMIPRGRGTFPGIGYGLTRKDFHDRDGFQPFSIAGSGDVVFIWETCPEVHLTIGAALRFHESIIRPGLPHLKPVALDVTLLHNFHGKKEDRAYVWSREAVILFGLPFSYTHIDSSGLLAWNDPDFILKEIVMCKNRMHDKDDLYSLVCEVVKKRLDVQERNIKERGIHFDKRDLNVND